MNGKEKKERRNKESDRTMVIKWEKRKGKIRKNMKNTGSLRNHTIVERQKLFMENIYLKMWSEVFWSHTPTIR